MEPNIILPEEPQKLSFEEFEVLHHNQLTHSGVPSILWRSLHYKLQNDVWDLGNFVAVNKVVLSDDSPEVAADATGAEESAELSAPKVFWTGPDLKSDGVDNIFLVDHAWTFDIPSARKMLESFPNLLQRMCGLMEIPATETADQIKQVLTDMWKYIRTYSVSSDSLEAEDKLPRWYMMDEIGSRVGHSDTPNCRIVPFYYVSGQITYSLLFPFLDINEGDELTRNYVEDVPLSDVLTRQSRLLPWLESTMTDVSFEPSAVPTSYFQVGVRLDSLPASSSQSGGALLKEKGYLNVFSEYDVLTEFLTDGRFRVVDNQADADILWYRRHFRDFLAFSEEFPDKFCNQFPNESILTCKDLLSIVCRRAVPAGQPIVNTETLDSLPLWLPTTYNLNNDLANFVAYFRAREARGLDNHWISKPWNLARSLDITISDSLNCHIRLSESGPKLVSKYIERPVLFHREDVPDGPVKFDIRFIVMLKSVQPLRVGIYKRFWLRFANKAFALDEFDVYDKHFTVMNYGQGEIHQKFCHIFIEQFDAQNEGSSWSKVEKEIYQAVREVFLAAVSEPSPKGLVHSPQSRAMYGLDFMLKWKDGAIQAIQPMLLEINFAPDCKRACDYYPDFFNDIFSYLFLDDDAPETIVEL
ncbi:Tubulin--tyrosine ligase-like protein 12 [Hypsibius exemplaris]|uniref:Tubulin--tyrosine ligase-like protein 12 n=1 Tax=Hypsibius exemplaris TaxID=2072580 RepID=A0A1W0X2P9_HYPEX|nr:Tubulin--tyrosine ligase-like protein 12 [Hypsibius exemplaris]